MNKDNLILAKIEGSKTPGWFDKNTNIMYKIKKGELVEWFKVLRRCEDDE